MRLIMVMFPFLLGCCLPWFSEGWDHQARVAVQRQYEQCHQRDHEGEEAHHCFFPHETFLLFVWRIMLKMNGHAVLHKSDTVWLLRCFSW